MTFLPIADRELRVAARKRSTFWVRIAAAFVAMLIGSGFLVLTVFAGYGVGRTSLGQALFTALTWLCLASALSAGLFLTSDCLSEEKREGTLGLLFLTDLRGYDVVLGKLLATSLRALYALLAVFPVLAVSLLMGGVTGAQFWKTSLALVNAMFLSLASGLFVSAISRDSQKALIGTMLLLLLLVAAGPLGDSTIAAVTERRFAPALSLTSPLYLFMTAGAWGQAQFMTGWLLNQVVGGTLLVLTCLLTPRTWQEKANQNAAAEAGWAHAWKFGGAKRRAALRRKLVGVNPVLWLGCRERWQAVALWIAGLILLAGLIAVFATNEGQTAWLLWNSFSGIFTLLLYLGIASQAGRFFVEGRRNGLLELLLATPLTSHQIVQGQWRALARMFGLPLVLWLVVQWVGAFQVQQQTWSRLAPVPPPAAPAGTTTNTAAATNTVVVTTISGTSTVMVSGGSGRVLQNQVMAAALSLAGTAIVIGNLAALIWFGMWMGLNSKNTNLSTLKTILFVQVAPWFIIGFASALVVPLFLIPTLFRGGAFSTRLPMAWYPLLTTAIATLLYLTKDALFLLWARRKLYRAFRERASRDLLPSPPPLPPLLPRADVPPLILPP